VPTFEEKEVAMQISPRVLVRVISVSLFTLGLFGPLVGFSQEPAGSASAVQEPAPYGQPLKPPPVPPGGPPKESTDPQVKAVLAQMAAAGLLEPKTLEQARKSFLFYSKFAGSPEPVFHVEERMIPGPAGDIPIRVYAPRAGGGLPVLVFFHGGGFAYGSLDTQDVPLRAITNRCACVVVSVAYRLAPENTYPAAPDDAYAATKWVAEHAQEIGGDPRRIAVGGDGAGGNLAAVVAMMARDRGGPRLMYQVLIYPSLDPSMLTYSWIASHDPIATDRAKLAEWSVYIPVNTDPSQPYISPINGNLHNLPPAFMIVGQNDPARDEDEQYAKGLKSAGVPVEVVPFDNMVHGFFLMAGKVDAGKRAVGDVAAALKKEFEDSQ
jgi:acetyl esterase